MPTLRLPAACTCMRSPLGTGTCAVIALLNVLGGAPSAWPQNILGFHDGYVTFTNANPALYYRIEFKPNLTGPEKWDGTFRNLQNIHTSDTEITVPVGTIYRVVGRTTPWVAGTAVDADILSGKTALVNDEEVTGTMANVGRQIVTPGTDAQMIAQGYHDGTGFVAGDEDLLADNIKADVGIFGVTGTYDGTPAYAAPLPQTGKTNSNWPGDDGAYRMGVMWPTPRFTVQTNTALVLDNLTGLTWPREPHAIPGNSEWLSINGALDLCASLTYAGHSDWRVPNVRELLSLIDYSRRNPALPAAHPFLGIQLGEPYSSSYWSSTPVVDSVVHTFTVNMERGAVEHHWRGNPAPLWPVRGGQ